MPPTVTACLIDDALGQFDGCITTLTNTALAVHMLSTREGTQATLRDDAWQQNTILQGDVDQEGYLGMMRDDKTFAFLFEGRDGTCIGAR